MKKLLVTALALFISIGVFAQETKKSVLPDNISVKTLDGKTVQTSEFNNDGKPYILSFWATWCKPCLRELNTIKEVYEDWQEETGVKIIAVSIDDARGASRVKPLVSYGMPRFNIEEDYAALHSSFPIHKRRPIIGITGNYDAGKCTLLEGYYRSVLEAGGTPVIIPAFDDTDAMVSLLEGVDALILSGGGDINPLYSGEEPIRELSSINATRDWHELMLVRLAANRQIPILGICRGLQVMMAALGGRLYQDIYKEASAAIKHNQNADRHVCTHIVRIASESLLHRIFKTEVLPVNSFHHQAVREVAPGFAVSALSSDGIIEAAESTEHKSMLGVQWHPECMILGGDRSMIPLFEWIVSEARSFADARNLHRHMLTLDTHCDTPMKFDQQVHFDQRDPRILVDLHKMTEGRLDTTIMVAYLRQLERDKAGLDAAFAKADRLLNEIETMVAQSADCVVFFYI